MLSFGLKLYCGRGIHGAGSLRSPAECPGKGTAEKDDPGWQEFGQAITRARILLKTDEGWTAAQVGAALDVSERTVRRAKRRYVEEGLEEVLRHHQLAHPLAEGG